jgi:hypothetical protein
MFIWPTLRGPRKLRSHEKYLLALTTPILVPGVHRIANVAYCMIGVHKSRALGRPGDYIFYRGV